MLQKTNDSDEEQNQQSRASLSLKVSPSRAKLLKIQASKAEEKPKFDLKQIKLEMDFIDKDALQKEIDAAKNDAT